MICRKNTLKIIKFKFNIFGGEYAFTPGAYAPNSRAYALWIYVFHLHPGAFLVCPAPGLSTKMPLKTLIPSIEKLCTLCFSLGVS